MDVGYFERKISKSCQRQTEKKIDFDLVQINNNPNFNIMFDKTEQHLLIPEVLTNRGDGVCRRALFDG